MVIKAPMQVDSILQISGAEEVFTAAWIWGQRKPQPRCSEIFPASLEGLWWWTRRCCVNFPRRHLQQSQHMDRLCGPADRWLCPQEDMCLQWGSAGRLWGPSSRRARVPLILLRNAPHQVVCFFVLNVKIESS